MVRRKKVAARGRAASDVDLRNLHVGGGPKRSRRDRKKPHPPENLAAGKADAREFADSLPLQPGVVIEPRGDEWQVQAPHNDEELWDLQLVQAFGTRSRALLSVFLEQLAKLCPEDWDADRQSWRIDETEWNAVLALVADWRPENSAQAALAAQMAATHLITMRLASQALNRGYSVNSFDASLTAKLARTFAAQCDAMQALKGKSRTAKQSIHVTKEIHEHVHFHDNRGGGENGNQPHEPRAASTAERPALPSNVQIDGQAVPSASGEREDGVP